ncbi:hypothetical protein O6H91_06G136400 [Diphasiastrum complanatum]|uniref:Uncharacterized protein n=1 Tax=Diphasiastrum complanatum TaxID=34168 RepID=A0ACC2DJ93_DIPCM|nr:hypothetical protein O6H91_06G136400 [Diphasiastrum complanatum]
MLPLPQFADQYLNSRIVTEHFKVGVKLQKGADDFADIGAIEIAVRELMHGEQGRAVRRRARALKEEAARSVAEGGSSYNALHAFIQVARTTHTHT